MTNIRIKEAITPDRLFVLLKTIGREVVPVSKLERMLSIGIVSSKAVSDLLKTAEELEIISIKEGKVVVNVSDRILDEEEAFREFLAKKMIGDSKFTQVLQSFFLNQELLRGGAKTGLYEKFRDEKLFSESYFKGFRFWFEYLGYGFDTNGGIFTIPVTRLKWVLKKIRTDAPMNFKVFIDLIVEEAPEFRDLVEKNDVSPTLSSAIKFYEEMGHYKLGFESDAYEFISLELANMKAKYSKIDWVVDNEVS